MVVCHIKKITIFVSVAISLVLVLGIFRGSSSIARYFELKGNLSILKRSAEALENSNRALELEIHKIKSSPLYARKILKDRYHAVDENEEIVFFPD